jgi:hypothetical protein
MAKRKAQYVCVEPAHLRTDVVRSLSVGRSAFELYAWLLLCPLSKAVPGVIFSGLGALRDELPGEWSDEDVRRCLNELTARGLVLVDTSARVVFLPELLKQECNAPVSSTQAVYWRDLMDEHRSKSDVFAVAEKALITLLMRHDHLYASYLAGRPLKEADAKTYLRKMRREEEPLPAPLSAVPQEAQLVLPFRADCAAPAQTRGPTPDGLDLSTRTKGIVSVDGLVSPDGLSLGEGSNPSLPTPLTRADCVAPAQTRCPEKAGPHVPDSLGEGSNPSPSTHDGAAAGTAAAHPADGSPPVVPLDFLRLAWPAFRARCGNKLGLHKLKWHDTDTGLPVAYDQALRQAWSEAAATMTAAQAAELWEALGDLVQRGRLDKLTAPVARRWMVFVRHFERYATEAKQMQRATAQRRSVPHRTYDGDIEIKDPAVRELAAVVLASVA